MKGPTVGHRHGAGLGHGSEGDCLPHWAKEVGAFQAGVKRERDLMRLLASGAASAPGNNLRRCTRGLTHIAVIVAICP